MTVAEALTLAFQYVNQPMPDLAIAEMAQDLASYPQENVLAALRRCRSELKAIRYGDILDRLPGGHPGPEEAWSTVSRGMSKDDLTLVEDKTIVWTGPMREAFGVVQGDDMVAARLAFKETYVKLVSEARARNEAPQWSVSPGTDKHDKERAITEALKQGNLTAEYARRQLPWSEAVDATILQLATGTAKRLA